MFTSEIPPDFSEFLQAVLGGDHNTAKDIIFKHLDSQHTTIIKCENCGEIIAFEKTRTLLSDLTLKKGVGVKYLVLRHILKDPDHNVLVPASGFDYPISQILEKKLRDHCDKNGVDFEEWFPSYVERWRVKASEYLAESEGRL